MKKYALFLLLLCIVHPTCVRTMEQEDDFLCVQLILDAMCTFVASWFSASDVSCDIADSQRIQEVRDEEKKIEAQLKFSSHNDAILTRQFANYTRMNGLEVDFGPRFFQARLRPFLSQIDLKPKRFLRYCYYQQYHNAEDEDEFEQLVSQGQNCVEQLNRYPSLLAQCQKARIEGCSALGAALLAKNITYSKRCAFMQKLMHAGFEFTEKDQLFLALYLYDKIPTHEKKVMMLVLQDNEQMGHLSVLPYDVRKYIVQCMVCACKAKLLIFLKS